MPGPRKGSGWPPGPTSLRGNAQDKVAPGFRGPAGGRTTPGGFVRTEEDKNANAGTRRQKTWAPRRRMGLGLGRWGCQRTTSTFSKRVIATTHGREWRRISHVASSRLGRGFFPPKTPPLPLGCLRTPPFPIKEGPRPKEGRTG